MATEFRDIQCGNDVARMAELGKFDQEFTVYGCAYRKNKETYYHISENPETIYRFWERAQKKGIYPTKFMTHSQLTGVPSGMEDEIWDEEKWNLGTVMADSFSDSFLELLNELGSHDPLNNAAPAFSIWRDAIEGRFRRDLLRTFDIFVNYCYLIKQLDQPTYSELVAWSEKVWKQMEDDMIVKDIFERSLHGYLYEEDGIIKSIFDAQFPPIYRLWIEAIMQGKLVTPIYSETLWFRSFMDFSKKKRLFVDHMNELMGPHIELLRTLITGDPFISKDVFRKYFEEVENSNSQDSIETMMLYGNLWHCI